MPASLPSLTRGLLLLTVLLIPTSLAYGAPLLATGHNKDASTGSGYVHNQIIIKLGDGRTIQDVGPFNWLNGVSAAEKVIEGSVSSPILERLYLLEFPSAIDVRAMVARYGNNPNVEYAQPNFIYSLDAVPNDPEYSKLWGLQNTGQFGGTLGKDIDAPQAWDIRTDSSQVVVGVIDTGVNYNHPDLVANMWHNPGEVPNNGMDDDGNGYTDDYYGYDFATCLQFNPPGTRCTVTKPRDSNPQDDTGHGTHVAGTIGAAGNNNQGVTGVSWKAKIMAIKALTSVGGLTVDLVAAVNYANMMNVKITNNSWGGGGFDQTLYNAIQAAGNNDALFIAAAGNGGSDGIGDNNDSTAHYPSSYNLNNIIAVAATNIDDDLTEFSNFGATSVDLAAPGDLILSTWYVTAPSFSDVSFDSTMIEAIPMEFSPSTTSSGITAIAQYAGLGQPVDFSGSFTGKIAVMQRGSITFADKVTNAMNAGAIGAVIFNNVDGMFTGTLGSAGSWIPTASMAKSDGDFLVTQLPRQVTFRIVESNYLYQSGTSMATPHVSGAAALMRAASPSSSYGTIKSLMLSNVDSVPSLAGKILSAGRLNLFNALNALNPLVVTVVQPANGAIFIHSVIPVIVSTNKPTSTISYSLDGGPAIIVGSTNFTLHSFNVQLHTLTIQATDLQGNGAASSPVQFYTCPGDVDQSGGITIIDAAAVAFHFDSVSGDGRYDFVSDMDEDGDVDIFDASVVAFNFDEICG